MLLLDVAPLGREITKAVALPLRLARIEPDEVALRGARGGHVELGLDPHGRVPRVGELGPLQEDTVNDDDELVWTADAQNMRMQPCEVEPVEVVALG